MKKRMTKVEKAQERMAERLIHKAIIGWQIPIMQLGAIGKVALEAVRAGLGEEAVTAAIVAKLEAVAIKC